VQTAILRSSIFPFFGAKVKHWGANRRGVAIAGKYELYLFTRFGRAECATKGKPDMIMKLSLLSCFRCKRKFFRSTTVRTLLLAAGVLAAFVGQCRADATVFIYHRFGEDSIPSTNVPVENFKLQMEYLRDNGYRVVPLREIADAVAQKRRLADKTVAITIDDGYLSTYTVAWPLLKRFGFPFTVFFYGRAVDKKYRNFITWPQIRDMKEAGVDFQDHGYNHEHFGERPAGLDDGAYKVWIKQDLTVNRALFEKNLGETPQMLALPYGEYNTLVLEAAREMGYRTIFSQDPGAIRGDAEMATLPREPILGTEWSTLEHFKEVLGRVDLPITDLEPSIAPLANRRPGRFGARILAPQRYIPGSFAIYVSELGWFPAKQQGDRVQIDSDAVLSRRQNRVMVSAREKDTHRIALRFWLLIADQAN